MARRINRSRACKESRRKDGEARTAEWQKLTPKQQLASLDDRLGKDVGAVKQRARIAKLRAKLQGEAVAKAKPKKKGPDPTKKK